MTHATAAYTDRVASGPAGEDLGRQIVEALGPEAPDAVIVFASSRFDYEVLLTALSNVCHPGSSPSNCCPPSRSVSASVMDGRLPVRPFA